MDGSMSSYRDGWMGGWVGGKGRGRRYRWMGSCGDEGERGGRERVRAGMKESVEGERGFVRG